MAITFVSSTISTATAVATAVPVAYPASIAAGDGLVLIVGTKPFSGTITTPAGWTALGEITNGSVASGVDTGSMKAAAFFLEATGALPGSLTVTITGGNSSWASILRFTKAAGTTWAAAGFATGTNSPADTSWSVPYSTNPGITSGDHLVLGGVVSTDLAVTWSAQTVTATGATITAPTALQNPRITTGNDSGGHVSRTTCTAGTASANPTWAATLSVGTNQTGSGVAVRLREITPAFRVSAPMVVQKEAVRRRSRRL